jgi:hypothetical protein
MSITLSTFRPLLLARIQASAALSTYDSALDDAPPGSPAQGQEDALRAKGVFISIPSILSVQCEGDTTAKKLTASMVVHLRTIPAVRTRLGDSATIESLIEAIIQAATQHSPERGSPRGLIQPAANLVNLVPEDSGCITYGINFDASYTLLPIVS